MLTAIEKAKFPGVAPRAANGKSGIASRIFNPTCSRKVAYMTIVLRIVYKTIVLTIRWKRR